MFTCSARDYVRIKGKETPPVISRLLLNRESPGQVKGDGEPSCFTKVEDTSIPALQQWCHKLTISSRSRAARNFLSHLTTFAKSIRVFLQGIGDVTEADRAAMKEKWESSIANMADIPDLDALVDDYYAREYDSSDDEMDFNFGFQAPLYSMRQTKMGPDGEPAGVMPRLMKVGLWHCTIAAMTANSKQSCRNSKPSLTTVWMSYKSGSAMVSKRNVRSAPLT